MARKREITLIDDYPAQICGTCGELKKYPEFPLDKNKFNGMGSQCLDCKRIKSKERKDYRTSRLRAIGMTTEEYNRLYHEQAGICSICLQQFDLLVTDHCHDSKTFRGLICKGCNSGLGFFKDNVESLANAIVYLERMKNTQEG